MQPSTAEQPWPLRQLHSVFSKYVDRLGDVWVDGELSSMRDVGHSVYLTLRDPDGGVSADLVMPRSHLDRLSRRPQRGDRVVVLVSLRVTTSTGVLLRVREMRLQGIGDLLAALERLRTMLRQEGLFNADRKRRPPLIPRIVGVVAGRDSDALQDVRRIADSRWPGVQLEVREVAVQGRSAVSAVRSALSDLAAVPEVDVIIVTRGGGSFEDLLPFSDEGLVRQVAGMATPVISAIGHEADRPILDDVADLRASTPTHAATLAVPDAAALLADLADTVGRLRARVQRMVAAERRWVEVVAGQPVLRDPSRLVQQRRGPVADLGGRLRAAVARAVEDRWQELEATTLHLRALSPQATLDRGYAVVTDAEGAVVREVVAAGAALSVRVTGGEFGAVSTGRRTQDDR